MTLDDLREKLRDAYDPHFRGFHALMSRRVKTILMVSNHYEAFSMARDASLTSDIYGTSRLLHLQNVPQVTTALSGKEALEILEDRPFDLVLASANLPDMSSSEFGQAVKARHPGLPVVLLVFGGRWFELGAPGADPAGIDSVFAWRGSAQVLLSIIKLVEDRLNVDRDLSLASIGIIIVVEDCVEDYSLLLPHVYATLMERTFMLVPQGINESDCQMRTRVRPKVLLARTFREARTLFNRYEGSLVGILSDLRIPTEPKDSGERFLCEALERSPGTPVLIHSAEPQVARIAQELGVRWVHKRSPHVTDHVTDFIVVDIGFGDFVFRDPAGREIARARNMWDMENMFPSLPDESIVFHSSRNDFSQWFRARGETTLASVLRPVTVSDFATTAGLREFLLAAVSLTRKEKYRGAIAEFRGPEFDPAYPFLVTGRGSLGGKGRGLAFMFHLMSEHLREDTVEGVTIRIPRTLVVAADEFEKFMRSNGIDLEALAGMADTGIQQRFVAAELSPRLCEDLTEYVRRVQTPLAVRSSSLLEDSHYQPFAGLYDTYMLPNNHPDPAVRLTQLCRAIKLVYASGHLERPRRYFEALGMNLAEEQMAVVIQEVAGRPHGEVYYPTFSGVAQSHNYYPLSPMKPEDGVATVALGLGKQVVEGGKAVRFCPRHPNIQPDMSSPQAVLDASQREFFALNLAARKVDLDSGSGATLVRLPLSRAEEDGELRHLGSVVSPTDDRLYDGVSRPGARAVTFRRLLQRDAFPLSSILNRLLAIGRENMGFALEIEFAVNLADGDGAEAEFFFLQMPPLVALRERCDLNLDSVPADWLLCRSQRVMGNGRLDTIRDVVYVSPGRFERAKSTDAAAHVARLNNKLVAENRPYLLLGPGRWGSQDPWIGIPVVWYQISGAKVIVEVANADLPLEPSQGTHFFHNMTSAGIGYFSLPASTAEEFVRWELLDELPGEQLTPYLRHVTLDTPLSVRMDGQTQCGLICLPEQR